MNDKNIAIDKPVLGEKDFRVALYLAKRAATLRHNLKMDMLMIVGFPTVLLFAVVSIGIISGIHVLTGWPTRPDINWLRLAIASVFLLGTSVFLYYTVYRSDQRELAEVESLLK